METTDQDIRNINMGNSALDFWLRDEKGFIDHLVTSLPYQVVVGSYLYRTVAKLENLPGFSDKNSIFNGTLRIVSAWCDNNNPGSKRRITSAIVSLCYIAGNRLLTEWIRNEKKFFDDLLRSTARMRWISEIVYPVLSDFESLPPFSGQPDETIAEACSMALDWVAADKEEILIIFAKTIIILNTFGQKRLDREPV